MEGRDEALIARYLAQEASAEEIREVEERKVNDKTFRQMLEDSEQALRALQLHQREELRNRFRKRDEMLDKISGEDPPRNRISPWFLIIGCIGLGLLIWMLIPDSRSSVSPAPVRLQDTASASEQIQIARDTGRQQSRQSEQIQPIEEKVPQKENPLMAQDAQQGDKLFAAFFSPYVDDMMDPAVRGDGELSPLEKFQLAYWEKRYAEAVKAFTAIGETMRKNDNVRFMYANALMAEGRILDAIPILESITQNNKSRYKTESLYVLGLGYCKTGDLKNGLRYMERYLQEERATRKAEALKLVQELK